MKKLKDFADESKYTLGGHKVSFDYFLHEVSGSDFIYSDEIGEMLDAALDPDVAWHEVDDLISPIAYQIVGEAFQEDHEIFLELVGVFKKAWNRMKEKSEAMKTADSEYKLDRETPEFFGKFDGLIHELAMGRVIKEFDNQPLGCYRVVVGERNQ